MSSSSSRRNSTLDEKDFRSFIVYTIVVARNPEDAIEALSKRYNVERPSLRIGLPKGESKALGCYQQKDKTIYISKQEYLYDPYIVIHEFYHHLRHTSGKHRGTEKHARDFALAYLNSFENSP